MRSRIANGSLGISQFDRGLILRPQPIAEEEGRDSVAVQPGRNLRSFMIYCEVHITSAGKHNDGACNLLRTGGRVDRQIRFIAFRIALGARRAAWPQQNALWKREPKW